jgi:hypothetical protein
VFYGKIEVPPSKMPKTPMPILPQFLPAILVCYWSILLDLFSVYLYKVLLERCHNHLLVKLEKYLNLSEVEKKCAGFRHQGGAGAPASYPIGVLVRCVLVMYLEGLSLRELEQRLLSDLLVRWFVGLSVFGNTPDHSTIQRFISWVKCQQRRSYFDAVLNQIDAQFPESRTLNQVGDTYAMVANAAEEDLVTLLRHLVRRLLCEAIDSMPDLLSPTVSDFAWHKLFGAPRERSVFRLNKKERQQRHEMVILAANDMYQRFGRTLQKHSSEAYPEVRLWHNYLGKVLHDEVVILEKADAEGRLVHMRTAKERRHDPDTSLVLGSATDPQATYRKHGEEEEKIDLGFNVQVATSKDGFIRETQAYTGAVPDQAGIKNLISEQVEHRNSCPPKLMYDMAAGTGKARAEVEEASGGKTQLVAHQMPYDTRSERFTPYDFGLSPDKTSLTCPNGKTSRSSYRSDPGNGCEFRFPVFLCWANGKPPAHMDESDLSLRCPFWEKCRDMRCNPTGDRRVFISDYRDQVLAANQYNQTDAFHQDMRQRPMIERIIFELTHYNGARRCRGLGLINADWQAKMCAVACNLKRWMRKIDHSKRASAAAKN